MKPGWRTKQLGAVTEIIAGQSPQGSFYNTSGDGLPFYQGKKEFGEKFIGPPTTWTSQITKVALEGDVLMSVRAPVGPVNFAIQKSCIGRGLAAIRSSKDLDRNFLFYFLLSKQDEIVGSEGAVFASINKNDIQSLEIAVPPLPEQERIVGILDEAFDGIAAAKANAEKNLTNARALFESHLQTTIAERGEGWVEMPLADLCDSNRIITYGVIKLGDEVPDGVPCLRTSNVRWLHIDTEGVKRIERSLSSEYSRTVLRGGEVLVNVRGTLGGVAVVPPEMAGWNVSREVAVVPVDPSKSNPAFLSYLIGSGVSQQWLGGVKKGAAYVGINIEDLRLLPVSAPKIGKQLDIVRHLEALHAETQHLESLYRRKLSYLADLKQSILQQAFADKLARGAVTSSAVAFPRTVANITPIDMHAGILAIAYQKHEERSRQSTFGHVKAEKIAHMIEAHVGIDLGRNPVKNAAGPNDYRHLKQVEHRAEKAGYFSFKQSGAQSYVFCKLHRFDEFLQRVHSALGNDTCAVDKLIELMVPMKTQQAEIFTTVFAAWNNLLIDGQDVSNEAIVSEARENWHSDKLKIPRDKFFRAIDWMKEKNIVPAGRGKKVVSRDDA